MKVVERWIGGASAPVEASLSCPAWTARVSSFMRRVYRARRSKRAGTRADPPRWHLDGIRRVAKEVNDDPKASIRRIPPLFAQAGAQNREAAQSRNLQNARRGREARAGGAVLQAPLSSAGSRIGENAAGGNSAR